MNGGTVTTTVPSNSNKISAVGSDSYTYDAAGNITDDGTNTYTWNIAGQLAEVLVSSTPVGTYTYDSQNRRTKKVAGTTTHYVYGLNGLLYGEYDNAGGLIREYVYLNGAPLAQIDVGAPETAIYLHPDHLGTPRFATNSGGTQVWAWAGDAFGTGAPTGSATINIRMPGQYVDAESGLFYNWNRYYNPSIGRYISSDPIGLEGGLNTFLYAEASPVMYVDPEGLDPYQTCVAQYTASCIATGTILIGTGTASLGTLALPGGGTIAGWQIGAAFGAATGAVVGSSVGAIMCSAEHTKNKRPSTKGKHQKGQTRKNTDYGGEKADKIRRPPLKPPPDHKGPWPPRTGD